VATHITLPCCASAAFDNNSSIMTVQFLSMEASDNQLTGLYTHQLQQLSKQHQSSAGREWWQCTSLCHVCASAAIYNNSSIMTMQFLFLDASNNQQAGLIQVAAEAAVEQFQIHCQSSIEGKRRPLESPCDSEEEFVFICKQQSTRTVNRPDKLNRRDK